jgi:uncharacterized membrane protein
MSKQYPDRISICLLWVAEAISFLGQRFCLQDPPSNHSQTWVSLGRHMENVTTKFMISPYQPKSKYVSPQTRFWEVDLLRGCAVILMVLFHIAFDLDYFGAASLDVHSGFWFFLGRLAAFLFVLLVGVSLVLSYWRAELKGQAKGFLRRLLKRGLWLLALAMGITLATYFLVGEGFIVFGVLHLIGVSILLAYPFLRLRSWSALIGILFIFIGWYFPNLGFGSPWLIWAGLAPKTFYSLDYFPLFPWFGVVLLGTALGDGLYRGYRRMVELPDLSRSPMVQAFAFLGRNSLAIYVVHQPALIAIMWLFSVIPR